MRKTSTKIVLHPHLQLYDIDFEMRNYACEVDPKCREHIENLFGEFDFSKLDSYAYLFKDVASKQKFQLIAKKQ